MIPFYLDLDLDIELLTVGVVQCIARRQVVLEVVNCGISAAAILVVIVFVGEGCMLNAILTPKGNKKEKMERYTDTQIQIQGETQ